MHHATVLVLSTAVLAACTNDAAVSPRRSSLQVQPSQSVTSATPQLTARELVLLQRLRTLVPGEAGMNLAQSLSNPLEYGHVWLRGPGSAAIQPVIDSLDAIRKMRVDSSMAVTRARTDASRPIPATVVLVAHLDDSTATAEVRRRVHDVPSDVILLRQDHPTVGALATAIRALQESRKQDGLNPTHDIRVDVHGEAIPRAWHGMLGTMAASELAALAASVPSQVSHVGLVRERTIGIAPLR